MRAVVKPSRPGTGAPETLENSDDRELPKAKSLCNRGLSRFHLLCPRA